ncbi:hypothetical protein FRC11_000668, partial [Ceratobasidium sp. 423]
MSLSVPAKSKFPAAWSFTDSHMGVLSCMVASPGGTRMVVASKSNNAVFFDPSTGECQGIVSFEGQFYVKAAVWYSENNLIVGCSNGSLYYVCLSPGLKGFAVTMCSVLKEQFPHQICALAVNLDEHMLAVGYGTTVALLNRIKTEGGGVWDLTQRIPGLIHDKGGLVASLLYFPGPSNRLSLLVLYTEAGFGVWKASGDFSVIPASNGTCRVGDGSITPNGGILAISTLDQTVVTYPLDENGPILAEKREYTNPEHVSQYPVVPIGITQDGLAFGGTTRGQVPVISTYEEKVQTLIQHEDENHIIRMISTLTDRIIIGSTNPSTNTSVIKCYWLHANTTKGTSHGISKSGMNAFRITVTEAMLGWRDGDCSWTMDAEVKAIEATGTDTPEQADDKDQMRKDQVPRRRIHITRRAMFVTGLAILAIMLVVTPPNAEPFNERNIDPEETAVLKPTMERHNYWILYGVRSSVRYFEYQITHWAAGL